jgi:hypothetical protein
VSLSAFRARGGKLFLTHGSQELSAVSTASKEKYAPSQISYNRLYAVTEHTDIPKHVRTLLTQLQTLTAARHRSIQLILAYLKAAKCDRLKFQAVH